MILLGRYPAIRVSGEYACFIKFKKFNQDCVTIVKSLPVRYYEPVNKVWEVPISDLDRVVNAFGLENIQIFNDFPEFDTYRKSIEIRNDKKNRTVDEMIEYYSNLKPEVDYKFKPTPDGHQIEAFNRSLHENNLIITDEMGLGKTVETIIIGDYKKSISQVNHILVICGVNGLKYNWADEIKKHSWYNCQVIDGTKKQKLQKLQSYWMFTYNIINIESLRNNEVRERGKLLKSNTNEILDAVKELCDTGKFEMIVIDEFHKVANRKSQQGKGYLILHAPYKIALSGTPITKRVDRSWSILHWTGFETCSEGAFKKRYCLLGGYTGYDVIGYKNLDEMHERFDKVQLRRTKELLKLPPKTPKTVYVEMTHSQRKEYQTIKNGIIQDVNTGDIKMVNPAVATIKLRMFTDKVKIAAVKDLVDELNENGNPCIIFSYYKDVLYQLKEELSEHNPILVTGDITKSEDKQKLINDFQLQAKSNVIMGTIQAMGTGYTLTRAQTVIFINKSWTPTDNDQATDRAHRRGTTGNVTVISVLVKNSIDERVEEVLSTNKTYIDKVVDGVPIFTDDTQTVFEKLMED